MPLIYKILPASEWEFARKRGIFRGSAVDIKDDFIHFSAAHQARETAARHFQGQSGLMLLAIDSADLGDLLKWEPSRGGDLFPHLYGDLEVRHVRWAAPLPWQDGIHAFPEGLA